MKQLFKLLIVPFLVLFLCAGTVTAMNITIYDGNGYTGSGLGGEDSETEPGMVNSQAWDLEGFFLQGTTLTMIGGYDFIDGETGNGINFHSGDIFIATSKPAFGDSAALIDNQTSDGNISVLNQYGYNYVLDLNFSTLSYNVYAITSDSYVITGYYQGYGGDGDSNEASNPWQYNPTDTDISLYNGDIIYSTGLSDASTGFLGGKHNSVSVELDFFGLGTEFYAHFTMECGNDNLMGHGTTASVPEPATMLLLGTGLFGLGILSRKRFKK